jgi:uncharacterized protein involved in exopolysaccharide biosynthesis
MEEELKLDFGKYIETFVRQWWFIVACGVMLGFLAVATSLIINRISPSYQAEVLIASTKTQSDVSFGSAIKSVSEADLATEAQTGAQFLYDRKARLQSFVALVKNGNVAEKVLAVVGSKLKESERSEAALMRMVSGSMIQSTDTIRISVNYHDPIIAAEIANAWGKAYVEQVNDLYGGSSSGASYLAIQEQTTQAKLAYDKTQAALTDFTAHNKIDEYTRQIEEIKITVTSLRGARSTAVSTLITEQVGADQQVIQELYKAQTANQLLALQQDQEARRQLITAYITGQSQARQEVFNQQVKDRLTQLEQAYTDRRQVKLFLDNAVSMREAVKSGGEAAANSNALALTLLKTQIYAAFPGSNTLQIQNLPETLGSNISKVDSTGMIADLSALINTLQTRQVELNKVIDTLSTNLETGKDFKFTKDSLDSTGELTKDIQDRYPELFNQGSLSDLSLTATENSNPLSQEVLQRSKGLLELKNLENLMAVSIANSQIEKKIQESEQMMRDLNSLISIETGKQGELTRARDLAWQTYSALATKEAEMSVAAQTSGIEVAFASPATPPDEKIVRSSINGATAGGLGLLFGIVAAYAYEFWQNHTGRPIEPILTMKYLRILFKQPKGQAS